MLLVVNIVNAIRAIVGNQEEAAATNLSMQWLCILYSWWNYVMIEYVDAIERWNPQK